MKKTFLILSILFLQVNIAHAVFSAFVIITPDNEKEHGFHVKISPFGERDGKYILTVPAVDGGNNAYLMISRSRLEGKWQNIRNYMLSRGEEGDPGIITMLKVDPGDEILLDKYVIHRSYIYIDPPHGMFDDGFYYSIDLSSYLNQME